MTDADQDAARRAIATYRDRQFADLIVFVVGLAAQTHGEELRKALGSVFSFEAVEGYGKRAMAVATEAQQVAQQARILLEEVNRSLDETDKRIDRMNARIDDAAKKFARIAPKPASNGTPKEGGNVR